MKSFVALVLCLILAIFPYVQANECEYDGKVYKVDESFTKPGECELYTCTADGHFRIDLCPRWEDSATTNINDNKKTLPFPECCKPVILS